MRSKLWVVLTVLFISIFFLNQDGWCSVIKNVKVNMAKDRDGYVVVATWDVDYNHWKYDFNTITQKGGIWMDCISSYDSKGYTYKTVVGSSVLGGLTKSSGRGTMSCHISKSRIPSNGYYMWVRIKVKIAGNWEEPIWLYAGRIK